MPKNSLPYLTFPDSIIPPFSLPIVVAIIDWEGEGLWPCALAGQPNRSITHLAHTDPLLAHLLYSLALYQLKVAERVSV